MSTGNVDSGNGKVPPWLCGNGYLSLPRNLDIGIWPINGHACLSGEGVSVGYCVRLDIIHYPQDPYERPFAFLLQLHPDLKGEGRDLTLKAKHSTEIPFTSEELMGYMAMAALKDGVWELDLLPDVVPWQLNCPLMCPLSTRNHIIKFVSSMQNAGKNEVEEEELRQVIWGIGE